MVSGSVSIQWNFPSKLSIQIFSAPVQESPTIYDAFVDKSHKPERNGKDTAAQGAKKQSPKTKPKAVEKKEKPSNLEEAVSKVSLEQLVLANVYSKNVLLFPLITIGLDGLNCWSRLKLLHVMYLHQCIFIRFGLD